jgi:hypothetical protein
MLRPSFRRQLVPLALCDEGEPARIRTGLGDLDCQPLLRQPVRGALSPLDNTYAVAYEAFFQPYRSQIMGCLDAVQVGMEDRHPAIPRPGAVLIDDDEGWAVDFVRIGTESGGDSLREVSLACSKGSQ